MSEEAEIAAKYAECDRIKASDMSPLEKLLAWPFGEDDAVMYDCALGVITIGDVRAAIEQNKDQPA